MEAQKEGDVVYFADGVHLQHNTKSTYCLDRNGTRERNFVGEWAFKGEYQCGDEGRKPLRSGAARYYKNKVLSETLKDSRIKQIFLPPYSPNLNLIE
jgi:hypothetical protein